MPARSWSCRGRYRWRSGRGPSSRLASGRRSGLFRTDLELDLPSAIGVRVLHPKLKNAELRDDGVDADRNHLPYWHVAKRRDLNFEQASVLKIALGIGEDLSRRVAASYRGGEEPEF